MNFEVDDAKKNHGGVCTFFEKKFNTKFHLVVFTQNPEYRLFKKILYLFGVLLNQITLFAVLQGAP